MLGFRARQFPLFPDRGVRYNSHKGPYGADDDALRRKVMLVMLLKGPSHHPL